MTDPILGDGVLEDIRVAVYGALATTGRLPGSGVLADLAGGSDRANEAIALLAERRAWALGTEGEIVLAHPFATRSFGYSVMSDRTLWWGGCCWDAFAIPHLVPGCDSVIVAGSCPACQRALTWRVATTGPPTGPERAHFLVPTARMWEDVIHTCSNQMLSATTPASMPGWPGPDAPRGIAWTWRHCGDSRRVGTPAAWIAATNAAGRPTRCRTSRTSA
jgi:hypothetical protein